MGFLPPYLPSDPSPLGHYTPVGQLIYHTLPFLSSGSPEEEDPFDEYAPPLLKLSLQRRRQLFHTSK